MLLLSKISILIFFLILSLQGQSAEVNRGQFKCLKSDIEYLIENHEELYKDNNKVYWELLNRMRNKAYATDSSNEIYQFLLILKIENIPTEVDEFLSEGFETLCVEKPILLKMAQQQLVYQLSTKLNEKLKNPLFHEEKELKGCRDK